ncbi:50S ribosomal protein L18 [Candidatus Kaiserbacteria bacterium GWA2_50_9]|uniref:Large ribosomal subunit protein uL18 n=1 Tax=Candidatus Kaiserbacteria bacterium GWA2_50_9 TaxID=1798474 RepID=A0A1F6BUC4_9BACT|nr:MAG: 50S ribosomal protein L18 [Candidatus Kaiserbacteria bacterium GWA2_50_9]
MKSKPTTTNELRKRRHARVRATVKGTAERPRLAVFRSNRFISVQLIDDTVGKTIVASHGREFKGSQSVQARAVGSAIAKAAKAKGITAVVFDRGGYRYGGQVKVLADTAREGGLTF